jgi:hypothetical protein
MDSLANVHVFRIQVLAIIGSLALIVFVIELVRRRRLKEEFSVLWLGMGIVFLVISLFRGLLDKFSILVGIGYPPAALFLILIMGLLAIMVHFSVAISELKESNKRLAQQIGLLEREIEER